MPLLTGGNIANVERVGITTKETQPRTFIFETASNASFTAVVDEGTENKLRIKNTVHGLLKTETLVTGYDIELQDQILLMEVFALIDGGTYAAEAEDEGEQYSAPVVGSAVNRVAFDLTLYTSDRDTNGNAKAFHEWKFPNCKGKPVSGSFKDGEFSTNAYSLESRPDSGQSAMTLKRIDALPAVV